MRKIFSLVLVVMVLLPLVQVQAQPVAPDAGVPIGSLALLDDASPTDQIIIKYKASADLAGAYAPAQADRMSRLSAAAGVPLAYFREMSGDAHVLRLSGKLPVSEVRLISERLMQLADVEYAEPDYIMQPALTPNDTRYVEQWHYFETWGINAPAAWDITTGSSNIVAAVIDTGITNHSDLAGRTVAGYDFISNTSMANDGDGRDADPSDPGDWVTTNECYTGSSARNSSWHGTHVAGTIGAKTNNNAGVAGINWVSKILPIRVLGKCGGMSSDIADGMRWAAGLLVSGVTPNANPAKVLNLSLGGPGACGTTYQTAVDAVTAAGATVIVAAGNDGADASGYQPASCNGVITVAATNRNGFRSWYSNYGSVVEISAPGGETTVSSNGVLSTLNSGATTPSTESYAFYQGTSMAAPHVAGVASLMLSVNPSLTPAQVNSILRSTARAFPAGGTCTTSNCGAGIVDAAAAVRAVAYDVGITKQVVGSNLKPGDRVTFTLSIANTGGVTATNVVVTDIVPAQVLTPTFASNLTITRTGVLTYVWNVGTLGLGKTGVITVYGRINPALPSDFSFTNSASISAQHDSTPGNNTSSATIGGSKVYLPIVMKPAPPPPNTFYATGDTCVLQGYPSSNYGTTTDMWVGYDDYLNPDGMIARSMIQFNTSAIPAGTTINSAVLQVYLEGSYDFPSTVRTLTAYRIGSSWVESTVTWNSQPSNAEAYGSANITSGAWGWYSFDVTNLVRGWVNGTWSNYGLMLRGPEWSGTDSSWRSFSTRETTNTPKLVLTYGSLAASADTVAEQRGQGSAPSMAEILNADSNGVGCSVVSNLLWPKCFAHR